MTRQIRVGPGKGYFQRRIAEGDTRQRALRSLKRRLARRLARVMFTRPKRSTETDGAPVGE